MKRISKIMAIMTAIAVSGNLLSGCSGKEGSTGKQQSVSEEENPAVILWEQENVEVQKVLDKLIKEFIDKNQDITVKRIHKETDDLKRSLDPEEETKDKPDIILTSNDVLSTLVPEKLIAPVSEVAGEELMKSIDQKALQSGKFKGKQYMVPDRVTKGLMLVYNKKLSGGAPRNFEELMEVSKRLKNENRVQNGLVFNQEEAAFTIPLLGAFGGKLFDDINSESPKVTLDTRAAKEWMVFLKRLQTEGIIPKESDYDIADSMFKEGKAAFIINFSGSLDEYKNTNIDYGIASIPTISGRYPAPYLEVKGYVISAAAAEDTKKKDAVKKIISFLLEKDAQTRMAEVHKQLPANSRALSDPKLQTNSIIALQKEQLDKAIPMPVIAQMKAVFEAVKSVQGEIFRGKVRPEDAPARMQKRAEDAMKSK